ncbi:MAG: DUF4124 domain-containing protein [Zoogloeaceae bacterium]|nr:DUF4124 domain-containing protein [Zoogloeaceae bacterium]MCK6384281.1 DUF4124 domain-containing protein [Rhodocyclaceae bacterium]
MKSQPHVPRLALLLGAFAVLPAFAQDSLRKCVDAKGKVVYQDFPCGQAPRVGAPEPPPVAADSAASPVMRQLDAAVKAAIAASDLPRAKRLAVTAEHWEWIAEAEKNRPAQAVTGRTQADLRAEKGASQECREARRNYELESRSSESIEKMKHLMYEACGMDPPPAEPGVIGVQPVIVPQHRPGFHPFPHPRPPRPERPPSRTTEPSDDMRDPATRRMDR